MLLQNSSFFAQYPLRFHGGAAAGLGSASLAAYSTAGKYRNVWLTESARDQHAGWPVGYHGIYARIQPIKTGGLGSTGGRVVGRGELLAGIAGGKAAVAAITGGGLLMAAAQGPGWVAAVADGAGGLSANIAGAVYGAAALAGLGEITWADGKVNVLADIAAILAGGGGLSGGIVASSWLAAQLVGSSAVAADVTSLSSIAALLSGGGEIAFANLAAGRYLLALITASGELLVDITANGNLSAEINIGGDTVTVDAGAIAAAVWSHLEAVDLIGTVQDLSDRATGEWRLDAVTKQMILYRPNGIELIRFNLFDALGAPAVVGVVRRVPA